MSPLKAFDNTLKVSIFAGIRGNENYYFFPSFINLLNLYLV